MVTRKNIDSYALVSVYDKSFLKEICLTFKKYKIKIISTGSTAKKIKSLGFKCKEISNVTKLKEILDGRVKTLNHKIHSSILFKRDVRKHQTTFNKLNFPKIDFVIVNFYPFQKISNNEEYEKKIEMIDIGGPALVRSGSKNFEHVTTICHKRFYNHLVKELEINQGKTSLAFRKKMAKANFKFTSDYDMSIFNWFNNKKQNRQKKIKLKYGENPNQKAYFLSNSKHNIFNSQVSGKKIGYNNILDISDGLNCLNEFREPTCLIVKHNNPCGIASAINIKTAFKKALEADPVSAFGGIVLFNRNIDETIAQKINLYFFEAVIVPKINKKPLNVLKSKKNLIVVNSKELVINNKNNFKSVVSGTLFQNENLLSLSKSNLKLVTPKKASKKIIDDLIFAFKVVKHVKSNAIVLVNNKQTIGIGAGQMSRLTSTRIALIKYKEFFYKKKFVCASDAFFPFTDNIKILLKNNCKAIIQPGGSINDNKVIKYASKMNTSLYFVNNRVFKH